MRLRPGMGALLFYPEGNVDNRKCFPLQPRMQGDSFNLDNDISNNFHDAAGYGTQGHIEVPALDRGCNRLSSENWDNFRQPYVGTDSSGCVSFDSQEPVFSPQQQYYCDTYDNVSSLLWMMTEQNELHLTGLDPASLVRAPPLSNDFRHQSIQLSKTSTTQPQQILVSPQPESQAPAQKLDDLPVKTKRHRRRKPYPPPEVAAAKHKAFLQRNREAASKCRIKKKAQIINLEDQERMAQQINTMLKDELKDMLGEVLSLRIQVKEMLCDKECDGCGNHATIRRESVPALSSYWHARCLPPL